MGELAFHCRAGPSTPDTPALTLPEPALTPHPQETYYPSVFEQNMAENPPAAGQLRNGKPIHLLSINMIKILEPEAYAYHMEQSDANSDSMPIDILINEHLAQMANDREPKTIEEACAIPAFVKAADEEIRMIREFETYTLVPREAVPPDVTPH